MHALYHRAARTVWRRAHGTVLVLPVADREVVALSGAGAAMWHLLAEPLTVGEMAHRLAEVYDVDLDVIVRDIAPVLDELAARRVLDRMYPA